tara:strand:- start:5643 stop:6332 length:690 start_codon:yes stop_codon:yes gene_type:complete
MALPKLNDVPKYSLKVPSTGQELKYRPYLVKEEKVLLIASSSEDPRQIMSAVYDTITACVEGVDVNSLTTFDLEYIFIKLRSKSTGESSEINIQCPECNTRNSVTIPLEDVVVTESKADPIIKLTDTITVEMKYPSYQDIPADADESEMAFSMIAGSLKAVISNDERIDIEDESPESVRAFLESMTQDQFVKISAFLSDSPSVKYDLEMKCTECEEENTIEIKGMQSFF